LINPLPGRLFLIFFIFEIFFHPQIDIGFPNQVDQIENDKNYGKISDVGFVENPVYKDDEKRHKNLDHPHQHIGIHSPGWFIGRGMFENVDGN
jgi:hypothetical protein